MLMTSDNFDTTLTALLGRRPYLPFTVEMHGGQRFEIDSAFAVTFRSGVAVFLAPGGVPVFFDHDSVNLIHAVPAALIPEKS